jgi:hypothetical protein
MVLAHLLGDYVFQTDNLVRWKLRSLWGIVAHGAVVALWLWLCSLPFTFDWWPYALGIGVTHTLIDIIRARMGSTSPAVDLLLFLADQAVHGLTIVLGLSLSGWLTPKPAETAFGQWLQSDNHLIFIIAYVLLTMPAWVSVHFLVRGMGASSTSLPGQPGEKYLGMIERGLIATFVLMGQFLLVPLVVAPRLALDGQSGRLEAERLGYLNETLISVALAIAVGLFLKRLS